MTPSLTSPLSAALLLLLAGCAAETTPDAQGSVGASELPEAPGTRVEVAVVRSGSASISLDLPATVTARSDATLAVPAGGYIESVQAKVGDRVSKGAVLARVDSATRKHMLDIAEAQAKQAEAEWARTQELGDVVSEQQRLAAQTQATVARSNAEMARLQLARSVVRAPFRGQVVEVYVEPGEVAGPGTPVVRLVQTDHVDLVLSVSGRDITQLRAGQQLRFYAHSVPGEFLGTVTQISAAADPQTRTFKVQVDVPNPEGLLLPGMLGRVAFENQVATDVVTLPQDWLITGLDSTGVFVDQGGVAEWREVEVQSFARDQAILASGLQAGDRVISDGGRDLVDGDPLLVMRSGGCCVNGRVEYTQ